MDPRADRRPSSTDTVLSGLAVLVAWGGTALALVVAGGVTRVLGVPDASAYDTEFIQDWVYLGTAVVAVGLLALAAVRTWVPPAIGLVGTVAGLWWSARETVRRYRESGWGDGLEVFVFVVPIGTALVGGVVVTFVHVMARARTGARSHG